MTNGVVGLIIGLLLGVYLTASYPGHVIKEFGSLGIPLLGHHAPMTSQ
jgi:hypothetical protein